MFLGANDDPFLPFEFEFSPGEHLDGRHVLVVAVDREPRPDDVPGAHTGWRRQMGILRDVRVTASDFLRMDGVRIEADPALYRARIVLRDADRDVDCCERPFGFRRIEARPDGLRLNGERIFLTGFNRHEDSPRTGLAEDRETTRSDLEQMKAAGANFVRLCHYPHASSELDVCDALGLIVLSEIPLYFWNNADSGRENQEARTQRGSRQLERMTAPTGATTITEPTPDGPPQPG